MNPVFPLAWILAGGAALAAFLTPALWNGYPFVFYDSADYIEAAFTFDMPPFRLLPYAFLVSLGRVADSLWPVVLMQIVACLLVLVLLVQLGGRKGMPGRFLAVALGTAILTPASWYAGLIMPDAFAAPAILTGVLVLAGWKQLGRLKYLALLLLPLFGMVHATHLLVLAGLSLIGLILWALRQAPKQAALALAGATLIAWLAVPSLHAMAQGGWFYNKGGSVFLLARLVSGGVIQKDLPSLCAEKPYLICAMQDRLQGDENEFLWGRGGVFFGRAGSIDVWMVEAPELLKRTVLAHPAETAGFMLSTAAKQFFAFGPGDVFDPMSFHMQRSFERRWPSQIEQLQNARQEHGWSQGKAWLQYVGVASMALGLCGLMLMLFLAVRGQDRPRALLAGLILAGLVGNALACGGLSSLADRYQARVAWLGLAVLLANWDWIRARIYTRRPSAG
ncbi:MAG: hypothetical protein HQL44_10900 [Alphaproteobacteria bacterium]|nr:hypothetical protein [Alphaproteobacteria bacterium]